MKSRTLLTVIGLAAFLAGAPIVVPSSVFAQTGNARSGEQSDRFEDADGDGYNDATPKKDSSSRKKAPKAKGKRFVDEDGDGINDLTTDTVGNGTASGAQGRKTNKTASSGIENALENGNKTGQGNGAGLGLQGALERGRKMGQNKTGEETIGAGNGKENNGKNRFGRDYIFNNKDRNTGNGSKATDGTKK